MVFRSFVLLYGSRNSSALVGAIETAAEKWYFRVLVLDCYLDAVVRYFRVLVLDCCSDAVVRRLMFQYFHLDEGYICMKDQAIHGRHPLEWDGMATRTFHSFLSSI